MAFRLSLRKVGCAVHYVLLLLKGKSDHAIAAVTDNQVIDLVYLRDVLPDLDEDNASAVQKALGDERLGQKVRELSAVRRNVLLL